MTTLADYRTALVSLVSGGPPDTVPPAVPLPDAFALYERMARARLRAFALDAFPETSRALGDEWERVFELFRLRVCSPYLRDEVLSFVEAVREHVPELLPTAFLEAATRLVAHLPERANFLTEVPFDLAAPLRFGRRHLVVPGENHAHLVYRDDEQAVHTLRFEGRQSVYLAQLCPSAILGEGAGLFDAVEPAGASPLEVLAGVRGTPEQVGQVIAVVHALLEAGVATSGRVPAEPTVETCLP